MSTCYLRDVSPEEEITIHKSIRFHPKLNASEKLFYAEIDSMCGENSYYFSIKKMVNMFEVSSQTINLWVKRLIELDLMEMYVEEADYKKNKFIKTKKVID